jgi:hypothetical protein
MIKIFILLFPIALSFKFYGANEPATNLQACTNGEINSAVAAIATCDQPDQMASAKCILNTLNISTNIN